MEYRNRRRRIATLLQHRLMSGGASAHRQRAARVEVSANASTTTLTGLTNSGVCLPSTAQSRAA
jgi:hypothetical protein